MDTEHLVRRATEGDLPAFVELTRRFQHFAFGSALALVGDFHHAEDVVQEALLAAWSSLPRLIDPAAFPGWLRSIVRHHAYRAVRRKHLEELPLDRRRPAPPRSPTPRPSRGRPPRPTRSAPARPTGSILPAGAPPTVLCPSPPHPPPSAPISPRWRKATRRTPSAAGSPHWEKCTGSTISRGTPPIATSRARSRACCAADAGHAAPARRHLRQFPDRPTRPPSSVVRLRRRAAPLRARRAAGGRRGRGRWRAPAPDSAQQNGRGGAGG